MIYPYLYTKEVNASKFIEPKTRKEVASTQKTTAAERVAEVRGWVEIWINLFKINATTFPDRI